MEWKRSYTDREMLIALCVTPAPNIYIGQMESGFLVAASDDERFGPVNTYIKHDENFLCAYRFKSIKQPNKWIWE